MEQKNNIEIYENILSLEKQENIKNFVLSTHSMPWYFKTSLDSNVKNIVDKNKLNYTSSIGFQNVIFNELGVHNQYLFSITNDIVKNVLNIKKIKNLYLNISRIFLLLPINNKTGILQPHIDFHKKHLVILYYVFNSDGETIFYEDNKNFKIIKTIEPKQGRCVLFEGSTYHSYKLPEKNIRCVLNINLTYE